MRVRLIRYYKYERRFLCLLDRPINPNHRNRWADEDYEISIDDFEIGLAFFPDENHTVTEADYEGLVGREFDIERGIAIHCYRVKDKASMALVKPEDNKWTEHEEECGRCNSTLCECGEFITMENYRHELEARAVEHEEETREFRERQDRDRLLREFIASHPKRNVPA